MRLTQILMTWPKKRPGGNIWTGKNRMVLKVNPWHMNQMKRDIEREKKNVALCLNPYITVEQERVLTQAREKTEERPDKTLFKMRKAFLEKTADCPTYVEDNFKHMKYNVQWEKTEQQG